MNADDVWVETETADGKKYYYHSNTRETIWDKPINVPVVTHKELLDLVLSKEIKQEVEHQSSQQAQLHQTLPISHSIPQSAQNIMIDKAWQEFIAPDGRQYYYNSITQETTWDKPKALFDRESQQQETINEVAIDPSILAAQTKAHAALQAYLDQQRRAQFDAPCSQNSPAQPQTSKGCIKNKKDKSKPVSSTAIGGTPWCVVWTGDNRVFFFNPSTKSSVWERPPELYGRSDVDKLITQIPKKTEDTSTDDDSDEAPPVKKSRSDFEKDIKPNVTPNRKSEDPAIQAELQAQREREKLPLAERLRQFKDMLVDKQVSYDSTFEKELSKIVFDPRYLLLCATERRACFEAFCREKAEAERREKKARSKEAKENFMTLLKEANLHGKSSFSTFASKFAKDERFTTVEKMRKREEYFKKFTSDLYHKEKEEKRERKKRDEEERKKEQKEQEKESKPEEDKKSAEDDHEIKENDIDDKQQKIDK